VFEQMVKLGTYYSSGRPVVVDPEIIVNDICSKVPLTDASVILDVGCGTGVVTIPLSRRVRHIDALDAGQKVLEQLMKDCKALNIGNISFHHGTACDLHFADGTFDGVIMYAVIHYLENESQIEQCIRELVRVCRPGGYILVADIPEIHAREEFEAREKTLDEMRILAEFEKNRVGYDNLFQQNVTLDMGTHDLLIDGHFLIQTAQELGCEVQLCKQDLREPFSLTRRDLLIHRTSR